MRGPVYIIWALLACWGLDCRLTDRVSGWPTNYTIAAARVFADRLRGDPYNNASSKVTSESFGRRRNKKAPGDYLNPPLSRDESPGSSLFIDSMQVQKIDSYLSTILRNEYLSESISSYLRKYDNVLGDSSRDEYFGKFRIDSRQFTFGGWFDKFAVVGIIGEFDNVDEFVKLAREYLNIRSISSTEVMVQTENDHFFYSVLDRKGKFLLRGYEGRQVIAEEDVIIPCDIIEFIKYYDEEFVP
jgi:hypothetical protein